MKASAANFCNANNNGNSNYNNASNANNYVRPRFEWRTKYFIDKYVLEGNFIRGDTPNMTSDAVCYDKYRYKRPSNFLLLVFWKMYEKLLDLNNLHEAYIKSKSGVEWKESVQRYDMYELSNIYELSERLRNGTYKQKPFYEFNINERGKTRHIKSLHISDRVLQRALCDYILAPATERYLIYDNAASVKGKGIEFSRKRLQTHLERYYRQYGREGYVLQIDFSKYFDNIRHDVVIEQFKKLIDDERVIKLLTELVATFGEDNKGVGIGSQISQVIGIYYPTPIDNYCKIVKACKFYGRYMDDTYIIHPDKKFLRELLHDIEAICDRLGIVINKKKTQIVKLSNGFTFLKIRYFYGKHGAIIKIPCRKTITRERRKLRKLRGRLEAGKITAAEIKEQYKSWRGNIIKYKAYKSVCSCDVLYKSLYGGTYGKEENGKRRG